MQRRRCHFVLSLLTSVFDCVVQVVVGGLKLDLDFITALGQYDQHTVHTVLIVLTENCCCTLFASKIEDGERNDENCMKIRRRITLMCDGKYLQ